MVRLDVAHALGLEDVIAALHLFARPAQRRDGLLGVGDDRREEVRNFVVERELDALGVDHEEAHGARAVAVEERGDERMDAYRFT